MARPARGRAASETAIPRGWWRRNALALAGGAVLLPATFGVIGWNEWSEYFSGRPSQPVVAAAGTPLEFTGATWGPARAEVVEPAVAWDVPAGSEVIVVSVPVDPGTEAVHCLPPSLRERNGSGRQWDEAAFEIGWSTDEPGSCAGTGTDPFTIVVPFLVPLDATGPFAVDLVDPQELPRFGRLLVEP